MTENKIAHKIALITASYYPGPAKKYRIVNLDAFEELLCRLEQKTHFSTPLQDVHNHILSAVVNMLSTIFKEMESKCDFFKNMTLIPTGSYFCGTRIGQPDEFDYVVDINSMTSYFASHPNNFTIERDAKPIDINVLDVNEEELKIFHPPKNKKHNEFIHQHFSDHINNLLDNPVNQYKPRKRSYSGSNIVPWDVYETNWSFRIKYIFRQIFLEVIKALDDEGNPFKTSNEKGTLQMMKGLVEHLTTSDEMISCSSTITMELVWRSHVRGEEEIMLPISVDITPSFVVPCKMETLNVVDVNVKNLTLASDRINHDVTLLRLLPDGKVSNRTTWKVSFSHTETDLIQNSGENHKKCLRVLKWMNRRLVPKVQANKEHTLCASYISDKHRSDKFYEMFVSYSVKTAMLWHVLQCRNERFGYCFLDILDKLVQNAQKSFFPVFVHVLISSDKLELERSTLKSSFVSRIQEALLEIAGMETIDIESCVEKLEKMKYEKIESIKKGH